MKTPKTSITSIGIVVALALIPVAIGVSVSHSNSAHMSETIPDSDQLQPIDEGFKFLGRGLNREENFNACPIPVTSENIHHLYREYDVTKVESTDLYLIKSKKIYESSLYFSRLVKMENHVQVAAITFYGWNIPYIFTQQDKYFLGLNSLATTAGINKSTFTCKTLLLDGMLNPLKAREFKYKEQTESNLEYVFFDTLIQRKDGYDFKVINTGFDSDHFQLYLGHLDFTNTVVSSYKEKCDQ